MPFKEAFGVWFEFENRGNGVENNVHPLKINMEPENDGFSIGISSCRGSFSGSTLVFGGVYVYVW